VVLLVALSRNQLENIPPIFPPITTPLLKRRLDSYFFFCDGEIVLGENVRIDDNTKPKRPRRDRMLFAYRYILDDKEEEDYNWVTLNDMFGHPEEEQFVVYLYELLATYIGDVVNDLKTPVMQGADLLNKRYKKQ
jgi:hypothetical protein